jgi:hypothetical protein
VVLNVIERPL